MFMKRILVLLLVLFSLSAYSQRMAFMLDKSAGSAPPPSGTTITKEAEAFDTYNAVQPYANDDVDASLYYMGSWDASGDYTTYGITTAAAGIHTITFRLRSSIGTGSFTVRDNSDVVLATFSTTSTSWTTSSQSITLANGSQTIKVAYASGQFDINWFTVDNSLQSPTMRQAFINTSDQFTGSPDYNGWSGISIWNTLTTDGTNLQTPGGFVNTTLRTDHLVKWGWGITNVTALTGVGGGYSAGTNTGIFDDQILSKSWRMTNGNQIKFTGLNPAKTYTVYAMFGSVNWESNTVSFTINSTTSSTKVTANNQGDRATYPNWYSDPALISVSGQAPTSGGDLVMTFNLVAGTYIPLEALVLKED